jgi:putative membrane protein
VVYASLHGYKLILTNSIVPLLSVVVRMPMTEQLTIFDIDVFRLALSSSFGESLVQHYLFLIDTLKTATGMITIALRHLYAKTSLSTSYDRYWEGRKAFATMCTGIRNMSRIIWVNTSLPPTDTQPAFAKGKTPTSEFTASQLRRSKIEALYLCLSFMFATKHYLRGEDGVNWADYQGVLPASFTRFDEARNSSHKTYAAIGNEFTSTNRDASVNSMGSTESRPDATKRIRVKRSIQQISNQSTPLLADIHKNADIHPQTDEGSLPLPLMYVSPFLHMFIAR